MTTANAKSQVQGMVKEATKLPYHLVDHIMTMVGPLWQTASGKIVRHPGRIAPNLKSEIKSKLNHMSSPTVSRRMNVSWGEWEQVERLPNDQRVSFREWSSPMVEDGYIRCFGHYVFLNDPNINDPNQEIQNQEIRNDTIINERTIYYNSCENEWVTLARVDFHLIDGVWKYHGKWRSQTLEPDIRPIPPKQPLI